MIDMNRNIKLLDDSTINKIAAGEVVERPSSVIKELLENSIDANSKSITVEISDGGKSYIRITDDGVGIDREDISNAFLRHSTSKISKVEDLSCIETLGFRGEALASISSVSQIELITKTSQNQSGVRTVIHGGNVKNSEEIGCPNGTTIIVKNLFFNTPVRQKFLKTDNTESNHISDIVYKLAISNPDISFNYIKDNKTMIKTPGRGDLETTVYSVLGKDFVDNVFEITNSGSGMSISGFIGKPEYTRSNRKSQYIFINGRYINDIGISRTIEQSYSTLITSKRYPVFLIYLDIDSKDIDINVHPTKTEVRFTNGDILKQFISDSVKSILYSKNLIPEVDFIDKNKPNKSTKKTQQKVLDSEKQIVLDSIDTDTDKTKNTSKSVSNNSSDLKVIDFSGVETPEIKINEEACMVYDEEPIERVPEIIVIGKLFKTYILGQDIENNIFYMIDQHAAHERVMYEKLKMQFLSQTINTQMLVATDVLELSLRDIELVKDNIDVFLDLGFEIEDFGTNTIALRGVPLVFGKPNSKQLFLDILDNLENNTSSSYELQLEKIMKLACTSAIKANDDLEDIEIDKLIEDLRSTKQPFTCPHGRPVIIEMTKKEIERKFKRT